MDLCRLAQLAAEQVGGSAMGAVMSLVAAAAGALAGQ
jgi:hypothetical protein